MIVRHSNQINAWRIVTDSTQLCFQMYPFNKIDEKLRLSQYFLIHLLFNGTFIGASHRIGRLSLGLYYHLSVIPLISVFYVHKNKNSRMAQFTFIGC